MACTPIIHPHVHTPGSPRTLAFLLLLLLLHLQPSQTGPVPGSAVEVSQRHNDLDLSLLSGEVVALSYGDTDTGRSRHKRQSFNFGNNAPPAQETTAAGQTSESGSSTPAPESTSSTSSGSQNFPQGGGNLDLGDIFGGGGDGGGGWGDGGGSCLNGCAWHECNNGKTCFFNSTPPCITGCRCPPPYDDPLVYNQADCKLLDTSSPATPTNNTNTTSDNTNTTATTTTTTNPSPSSTPHSSPSSPPSSPPQSTTLKVTQCRGMPCVHGYCNASRSTRPCRCDPGWRGFFCDTPCSRNCSNGGQCHYLSSLRLEACVCPDKWTGENCTELKPDPNDMTLVRVLLGSLAGVTVLVVVGGAVLMFFLWRRRLVFALKIVNYFLPYEDNDGRQYDAFVSYVMTDADVSFVHSQLRPKLENEMGFHLCLHQRDFLVGAVISDTILEALEDSRRFILILTPAYLNNEWAQFEFQRAFQEMLKRKLRIIPILLQDLSWDSPKVRDTLNPTLKHILDSVAVLKIPDRSADERQQQKFWKRLKLCMPKKKTTTTTTDEQEMAGVTSWGSSSGGTDVDKNKLSSDDKHRPETISAEPCWTACNGHAAGDGDDDDDGGDGDEGVGDGGLGDSGHGGGGDGDVGVDGHGGDGGCGGDDGSSGDSGCDETFRPKGVGQDRGYDAAVELTHINLGTGSMHERSV